MQANIYASMKVKDGHGRCERIRSSVEGDVMSVERRDSVSVTSFKLQPQIPEYGERGEIISDYAK